MNNVKKKCFICDKTMYGDEDMKDHFTTHLKFKPFKCLVCLNRYSEEDELKEHMKKRNHDNYERSTTKRFNFLYKSFINTCSTLANIQEEDVKNFKLICLRKPDIDILEYFKDNKSNCNIKDMLDQLVRNGGTEVVDRLWNLRCILNNVFIDNGVSLPTTDQSNSISSENSLQQSKGNSKQSKKKPVQIRSPYYPDFLTETFKINGKEAERIKHWGYLDFRYLQFQTSPRRTNISKVCKVCNLFCDSAKRMVEHIFNIHMKMSNPFILKCAQCYERGNKTRSFMEFNSLKNHVEEGKQNHHNRSFVNNLSIDYTGKIGHVLLDAKYDTLTRYQYEFERCFLNGKNNVINPVIENNCDLEPEVAIKLEI
uniref:C2H2-type domain-containing protein n=1 Tax=Parastrongyloides trichosuri TaxID=131310 RepID=A0A0N4Z0F7_PARTI